MTNISSDRSKEPSAGGGHYCGPGCDANSAIPIPTVSVSGAAREATEAQVQAARLTWDAVVPQHESVRMSDGEWTCTCTHPRDLAFASAVDWEAHSDVAIAHAVADAVVAAGPVEGIMVPGSDCGLPTVYCRECQELWPCPTVRCACGCYCDCAEFGYAECIHAPEAPTEATQTGGEVR